MRRAQALPTAAGVSYVRRRSRLPRCVTVALTIAVLGLVWVGTAASMQVKPGAPPILAAPATATPVLAAPAPAVGQPGLAAPASANRQPVGAQPAVAEPPEVFATVDGLSLNLPYDDPVAVAFHEAAQPEALPLQPSGRLLANDNPSKFTPVTDRPGPAYRVLSTRGRQHPATSAVDIVVPRGTVIAAPVSGRVVEVRQYPYDETLDWRVVIEPDGDTGLQVVLIHLEKPRVRPGQRVVAGETPLAEVRLFGFSSQVDYLTERHLPHAHVEVKRRLVVDPDAPAVMPVADR